MRVSLQSVAALSNMAVSRNARTPHHVGCVLRPAGTLIRSVSAFRGAAYGLDVWQHGSFLSPHLHRESSLVWLTSRAAKTRRVWGFINAISEEHILFVLKLEPSATSSFKLFKYNFARISPILTGRICSKERTSTECGSYEARM